MNYTITSYDGNFTIAADSLDTSNSALSLPGKDWSGWGEFYSNNFIHLLENFAVGQPSNPRTGQLWYNPANKTLNLWDKTVGSWNPINSGLSSPVTISISNDAFGSVSFQNGGQTYNLALTLSPITTAGTYEKVVVNAKGLVTSGGNLTSTDITNALGYTPGAGAGNVSSVGIGSSTLITSGGPITSSGTLLVDLPPYGTAGSYEKVNVDSYGRVISGGNLSAGDISALGFFTSIVSSTLAASGNVVNLAAINGGSGGALFAKIGFDGYGRVTAAGNLTSADIITALGYTPASSSAFSQSFNNPGWVQLPNGFIIQWGHGNGGARVTWPIVFPHFCLFPMAGPPGPSSSTDNVYSAQFASYDASGGTAYAAGTTGVSPRVNTNYSYPYIALGY